MTMARTLGWALPITSMAVMLSITATPLRGQGFAMDAWRRNFSERLDQSIAELRDEGQRQSTPPLVVKRDGTNEREGRGVFVPSSANTENENRFPVLASILRAHGLPPSLLGVAAVESGFDPSALSPKGARGLWQLMPETARRYGLAVEPGRDERLDPVKSTHAAARYMTDLYAQFQDWPLTFAAYNAGENRVERALDRRGAGDFWTLSRLAALPEETRRYVPAVLANLEAPLSSWNPPATSSLPESSAAQGRVVYAFPTTPLGVESK